MELLRRLLNECLLVIRQVFKVDLKDRLIIHVDDYSPTRRAKSCVNGKKWQDAIATHSKPRETAWSRSRALPGLRRTSDWMVMTEGVPVSLTLQLMRREN